MDVFDFRNALVTDYAQFSRSFTPILAPDIRAEVDSAYARQQFWPPPLIQLNPNYQRDHTVQDLVRGGTLDPAVGRIFRTGKDPDGGQPGQDLILYRHQVEAISLAQVGASYVVTTGAGSGKSLTFFIPIIDHILKARATDPTPRTRAIIIYPMNALANSQLEELRKFLRDYPEGEEPIRVRRYTGQESQEERRALASQPADILLTNFMMLELILTRFEAVDRQVMARCQGLCFLVLDELHTYRGRQGADVAMLVRRLRQRLGADRLQCIRHLRHPVLQRQRGRQAAGGGRGGLATVRHPGACPPCDHRDPATGYRPDPES